MGEYSNRQDFDLHAPDEELMCDDPTCKNPFAHKAHTNTDQKVIQRNTESGAHRRPTVSRSSA